MDLVQSLPPSSRSDPTALCEQYFALRNSKETSRKWRENWRVSVSDEVIGMVAVAIVLVFAAFAVYMHDRYESKISTTQDFMLVHDP